MFFLIEVKMADIEHINGIIKVCSEGYRDTYMETPSEEDFSKINPSISKK